MGFRALAFESVFENSRGSVMCVLFNRAGDRVTVFAAAASDRIGNITFHKDFMSGYQNLFFTSKKLAILEHVNEQHNNESGNYTEK